MYAESGLWILRLDIGDHLLSWAGALRQSNCLSTLVEYGVRSIVCGP